MARMGHDTERAAMIHQHEARGADRKIARAIDAHMKAERDKRSGGDECQDDDLGSRANGTLMARGAAIGASEAAPDTAPSL